MNRACTETENQSEKQIYDKFSLPYFITFIFMQKGKKHRLRVFVYSLRTLAAQYTPYSVYTKWQSVSSLHSMQCMNGTSLSLKQKV